MNNNILKCCDECWHESEKPCNDYIDCLNSEPKCHSTEDCKDILIKNFAKLRYEEIDKPVVFLGTGTCGLGAGAGKTKTEIKKYFDNKGMEVDIVDVGCIGICALEPIMDIQMPGKARLSFKQVTSDTVNEIFNDFFNDKINEKHLFGQHRNEKLEAYKNVPYLDEFPFFKLQTRWVLENCGIINPINIDEYISRGGFQALSKALRLNTPIEICDTVERSGLKGRGGGGFLTGKKWKFAHSSSEKQRYLICNADEGDPGAFMDRAVIEGDPYRLIEGMVIAAYAIGANKAYVYIRAEYPLAIKHLKIAMDKAKEYGLLGTNILDTGFNLELVIKMGAGAFVCGEETALMNSIEGKRGMPRPRPPYPAVSGLFGKPTIVNNVETLANVPKIIKNGEEWFSSIGTERSKGTKVFALSGNITYTGLVEVAMGTKIREIVFDIGGGIPDGLKYKAVQIGGPSGGCIPESHLDTEIDYESLKQVGAMMGSGGLVVMDERTCMVDVATFFMDFIQRESCGKCIPCREGTKQLLEILHRITSVSKQGQQTAEELERYQSIINMKSLANVIKDTSLCGLGKSAPNPVLSTLRWFKEEYEAHIFQRKCPAKVCKGLLTFTIIPDACTGCTLCTRACPADAILGTLKHPHHIIHDKCIGCGSCVDVCKFNAINVE